MRSFMSLMRCLMATLVRSSSRSCAVSVSRKYGESVRPSVNSSGRRPMLMVSGSDEEGRRPLRFRWPLRRLLRRPRLPLRLSPSPSPTPLVDCDERWGWLVADDVVRRIDDCKYRCKFCSGICWCCCGGCGCCCCFRRHSLRKGVIRRQAETQEKLMIKK